MDKFFLGCDWGTSSFRLRLFDIGQGRVIGEVVSDDGIAVMHRTWQKQCGQHGEMSKADMFRQYLQKQVDTLARAVSQELGSIPILISGMASSSIGMEDIPYAAVPFALDGTAALVRRLQPTLDFNHEIILISGVRSKNDVMRGEETQLIGLLDLLQQNGIVPDQGVLILPGTHSKHVYIDKGQLVDFKTFMTGELYNILSHHSILKDSVDGDRANETESAAAAAFKAGIRQSTSSGILNGLFTVRTNQLFDAMNRKQNGLYLSGLLIGEELQYLLHQQELPLFLCSGKNLFGVYGWALEELQLMARTTILPFELVDRAAVAGQQVILKNIA